VRDGPSATTTVSRDDDALLLVMVGGAGQSAKNRIVIIQCQRRKMADSDRFSRKNSERIELIAGNSNCLRVTRTDCGQLEPFREPAGTIRVSSKRFGGTQSKSEKPEQLEQVQHFIHDSLPQVPSWSETWSSSGARWCDGNPCRRHHDKDRARGYRSARVDF
jgi:hypothetical protein